MPSVCRSFQELLVVQISHKLTKYWACNGILCHMALLGVKELSPNIIIQILLTSLHRFYWLLIGRTFSNIQTIHLWWSIAKFSWPVCVIIHWYEEEKFDSDHSWGKGSYTWVPIGVLRYDDFFSVYIDDLCFGIFGIYFASLWFIIESHSVF